jgi:RimJ/RimL family protein N-acetyltransferase
MTPLGTGPEAAVIDTARLRFVTCAPAALLALIDAPERFEVIAGFPIAPGLGDGYRSVDVSADWVRGLRAATDPDIWRHGVFAIDRTTGIAVGVGGFKGSPDETGTVEIAYGVARVQEGRGFATEIATALTAFAFEDPRVTRVIAHTKPANVASSRVLEKCGFTSTGRVIDPEDGEVCRWEKHL